VASPWLRGKNIKYKATIAFNQLRNADAVSYSVQSVQYKLSDSLGAYWQCVPNYALIKIYLRYLLKIHKRFIWLLFKTLAQLCFLPPIKNNFNNTYFLLRRWQDKVTLGPHNMSRCTKGIPPPWDPYYKLTLDS
jgi:hypothetical protein